MERVSVKELSETLNLRPLNMEAEIGNHFITLPDTNRPSLQLTGFWEGFEPNRIQIVGQVEFVYLEKLEEEVRFHAYEEFFSQPIPCVIYTRGFLPEEKVLELATKKNIPLLSSSLPTSVLTA